MRCNPKPKFDTRCTVNRVNGWARLSVGIQSAFLMVAVLTSMGCRNTNTTAISPAGTASPLSPLSPVQGTTSFSPIQPTSGISPLGAPTRVPPPPTGSYNSSAIYSGTTYNTPSSASYAPTQSLSANGLSANSLSAVGLPPSGATVGSRGMTRGVTDLNSGVRQTAWTGTAPNGTAPNGTALNGTPTGNQNPNARLNAPPNTNGTSSDPRAGGMRANDLTNEPYPPGYVPPQNRPGAGFNRNLTVQSIPSNAVPLNQRFTSSVAQTQQFQPRVQTAGMPSNATLPSTEPFPTSANQDGSDGFWQPPSPRF